MALGLERRAAGSCHGDRLTKLEYRQVAESRGDLNNFSPGWLDRFRFSGPCRDCIYGQYEYPCAIHLLCLLVGQNRIAPAPPFGSWLFEEELTVLVLKQEGLPFSAFDLLDQETPALEVAENRHSGDLR